MEGIRRKTRREESGIESIPQDLAMLPQGHAFLRIIRESSHLSPTEKEAALTEAPKILEAITRIMLDNTRVYEDKNGTKFPYTKISLKEVVDNIFEQEEVSSVAPADGTALKPFAELRIQHRLEFIFPPIPRGMDQASFYEYSEIIIKRIFTLLPGALARKQAGLDVPDVTICDIGYPSNKFGNVSTEYLRAMEESGFDGMAEPFAEFVANEVQSMPQERAAVTLSGVSIGASVAALVARELQHGELVETLPGKNNDDGAEKPIMGRVRLLIPATLLAEGESADSNYDYLKRGVRLGSGLFFELVKRWDAFGLKEGNPSLMELFVRRGVFEQALNNSKILAEHGVVPATEGQAGEDKKACISAMRGLSISGMSLPDNVATVEVIADRDDLMLTEFGIDRTARMNQPDSERGRSLAWNAIPPQLSTAPSRHKRRTKGSHYVRFFQQRSTVGAAFDTAVALQELRSGTVITRRSTRESTKNEDH